MTLSPPGLRLVQCAKAMQFESSIHPQRPVPALIGNGRLVTTVGRDGYHEGASSWGADGAATQEFVIAGRRLPGARHSLIPFGRIHMTLWVKGETPVVLEQTQSIHTDVGEVRTRRLYDSVLETSRSLILRHRNTALFETRISNHSQDDVPLSLEFDYVFGKRGDAAIHGLDWSAREECGGITIEWESGDNLGAVYISSEGATWESDGRDCRLIRAVSLGPGDEFVLRTAIDFSDREEFVSRMSHEAWEREIARHAVEWRAFWSTSEVVTGDADVDAFRLASLYTLACQATPWSIPPTVSERYWGAGAFHDEYYPYMGLASAGHERMASRIPKFRLLNLPEALRAGKGSGALYPWSSTEDGRERDPLGHWYTERFHLGQIAATAWTEWLYSRRIEELQDLYSILRECARYFELEMLVRDERGRLVTRACTDFDESVGEVEAGPFTMAAAVYCLDHAAEAARRLGVDHERRVIWSKLSDELRQNFAVDAKERRYIVPGGKSQHYSVVGYVVPFLCDDASEFARRTVGWASATLKTEQGWKPGLSKSFDGTTWIWTAGHLGMCFSVLRNGEAAWEAVRRGPLAAGQFMSPNEHLDAAGNPIVPWFTTGCGAWLAALHWMFVRVDDMGDHLFPAVPESLPDFSFRSLRLSKGVTVDARVRGGKIDYLSFGSPTALVFQIEVPRRFAVQWPLACGKVTDLEDAWRIQFELLPGENTIIEPGG